MILIPTHSHEEMAVQTHFLSPLNRSIRSFSLEASSLDHARESLSVLMNDKKGEYDEGEYTFLHGFDWGEEAAHLARAAYDVFHSDNIWSIPVYEPAEVNSYTFKQPDFPLVSYIFNFEPYIRYDKGVAIQYYHALYEDLNMEEDTLLLENSDFYKEVINNIRGLVNKEHTIVVPSDYCGLITKNLMMNDLTVVKEGKVDCLVLSHPRYLASGYIKDQVKRYDPDIVITAGKYTINIFPTMDGAVISTGGYKKTHGRMVKAAVEFFTRNKNIHRDDYAISKLERK